MEAFSRMDLASSMMRVAAISQGLSKLPEVRELGALVFPRLYEGSGALVVSACYV